MPFINNIPQAADALTKSQPQIRENMNQCQRVWVEDHVSLTRGKNKGKHRRVRLVQQSSAPATSATELAWYTKSDSGTPNIYFRPKSSGTEYHMTRSNLLDVGLKLEAFVAFNIDGSIRQQSYIDESGVKRWRAIKTANVQGVTQSATQTLDYTITFSPALSTADYFWQADWWAQGLPQGPVDQPPINNLLFQPKNDAAYGTSVQAGSLNLVGYKNNSTSPVVVQRAGLGLIVIVQIYTPV